MAIRIFCILFLIAVTTQVSAQLCQGSLGDPIVNITFGQGSNPGPQLSAAATNYSFTGGDCPQDGFYTVRTNSIGCFSNTWHTLTADHTGNTNGYLMLVNASFQPSAFYVDTVRGLCGNTQYEFASWIMNMLVPSSCNGNTIQPNLTFTIERTNGVVLQSYNTGNIAPSSSGIWKQYGFYFTSPPAGSDIVLRIVNNAPGGCGNDLALDDITFRACGPQVNNSINNNPVSSMAWCEGEQKDLSLTASTSGGFINPVFQWQRQVNNVWTDVAGAVTNNFNLNFAASTAPGVFRYRLAIAEAGNMGSPQCRIYSLPFVFTIHAKPQTTVTSNSPVCVGKTVRLTATGGSQYSWAGPNGFTATGGAIDIVNFQSVQAGQYYVTVSNPAGCTKKDSVIVSSLPSPSVTTSFTDSSICKGDDITLHATGGIDYSWSPSAALNDPLSSDPVASPDDSTLYQVVITNGEGCTDTAYITVNVLTAPIAFAGPDRSMIEGQPIMLEGGVVGDAIYYWSPPDHLSDISVLNPVASPPADTRYVLNVTSQIGCGTATDTVFIKVYKDIFIPNAFSPNGDGINDTWNIKALDAYPAFQLVVFNRWGQQVYQLNNAFVAWDGTFKGKPLPMGAYYYILKTSALQQLRKGSIMIIR